MRKDDKAKILDLLSGNGGYTTGEIASQLPTRSPNPRQHTAYVRSVLLTMKDEGLLREMGDQKPVVWILAKGSPPQRPAPAQSTSGCRQQLSCDSKEILEHAAHAELSRLRSLRSELGNLQAGATAFVHLDARLDALELALRQLGYAYIDQFEEGRAENDRAGRLGLTR